MKSIDRDTKVIDSYISLLKNMSAKNKLDLILKLTKTVSTDIKQEKSDFYKTFGGWEGRDESAEELINTIKGSRTFNRTVVEF